MDNIPTVRAGCEAIARGDTEGLLRLMVDDVEWVSPVSGSLRGPAAVRDFFRSIDRIALIEQFDAKEFVAQGDTVVVTGVERARVKNTSQHVEQNWAMVLKLRDGRITRVQMFGDTAAIEAVLGESEAERRAALGPMGVTEPPFSSGRL